MSSNPLPSNRISSTRLPSTRLPSTRNVPDRLFVPGLVLAAWTLLLWSTRIRNALGDDSLVGWSRTWQVGVSVAFVVVALVLAGLSLSRSAVAPAVGAALAVTGSVWWTIRGIGIVVKDYEPAFTIVHVVLAVGTVAISAWLLRQIRVASLRHG